MTEDVPNAADTPEPTLGDVHDMKYNLSTSVREAGAELMAQAVRSGVANLEQAQDWLLTTGMVITKIQVEQRLTLGEARSVTVRDAVRRLSCEEQQPQAKVPTAEARDAKPLIVPDKARDVYAVYEAAATREGPPPILAKIVAEVGCCENTARKYRDWLTDKGCLRFNDDGTVDVLRAP